MIRPARCERRELVCRRGRMLVLRLGVQRKPAYVFITIRHAGITLLRLKFFLVRRNTCFARKTLSALRLKVYGNDAPPQIRRGGRIGVGAVRQARRAPWRPAAVPWSDTLLRFLSNRVLRCCGRIDVHREDPATRRLLPCATRARLVQPRFLPASARRVLSVCNASAGSGEQSLRGTLDAASHHVAQGLPATGVSHEYVCKAIGSERVGD